MTRKLQISRDPAITLPLDTVTSTIIVYGGKGMGKTVFGKVLAEELSTQGLRWSWLDPLGVSWGIRHSADGAGPGVECLILGGAHGDIPIEPEGGAAVADVVVEENVNVVIDFSRKPSGEMWSIADKIRFVTAYGRRLFQRQGDLVGGRRREPILQFLDEGARYIPQVIPRDNVGLASCVSAWQQIAEEGRNIALGLCVLTQRSARINKDIAELADAMFAFRTVGPNSLDAVLDWLGEHVTKERRKPLAEKVRELPKGSALVVSPGWLHLEQVVPIRMCHTFDSSATPKPGERPPTARGQGAKPDLMKIQARMAETIVRVRMEDPKKLREDLVTAQLQNDELQQRIVGLEHDLEHTREDLEIAREAAGKGGGADPAVVGDHVDIFASQLKQLDTLRAEIGANVDQLRSLAVRASGGPKVPEHYTVFPPPRAPDGFKGAVVTQHRPAAGPGDPEVGTGGLQRMLIALAQRPGGMTKRQLGLRAGLSSKSGTFATYLGRGRSQGWIGSPASNGKLEITEAGRKALGSSWKPLPKGRELQKFWLEELGSGSGAARMLSELCSAFPKVLTAEQLGQKAGISSVSGTFATYLGKLRSLELVEGGRGGLKASQELFN